MTSPEKDKTIYVCQKCGKQFAYGGPCRCPATTVKVEARTP